MSVIENASHTFFANATSTVIQMNYSEMEGIINEMILSAHDIDILPLPCSDMGENSKVFDTLFAQYLQFHTILENYQQLILKDLIAINKLKKELEDMDNALCKHWIQE